MEVKFDEKRSLISFAKSDAAIASLVEPLPSPLLRITYLHKSTVKAMVCYNPFHLVTVNLQK